MKKEQFELLVRELLSNRDDFRYKGNLAFLFPIQNLLRGIYLERSAFNTESFYVSWFILPMYVPTTHLYLNFGDRILNKGGDRWSLDNNELINSLRLAIYDQALPTLTEVASIEKFTYFLKKFSDKDPYALRASVYSLVVLKRFNEALAEIDQLKMALDPKLPWQAKMNDEITRIEEELRHEPLTLRETFNLQGRETAKNLRLEKFI